MKTPEEIRVMLTKYFQQHRFKWLIEEDIPFSLSLGVPKESQAINQPAAVRAWVNAWQKWQETAKNTGSLSWCERKWKKLGAQSFPEKLQLNGRTELTSWIGKRVAWETAQHRYQMLVHYYPQLEKVLPHQFDLLAEAEESEFCRLIDMLHWLNSHPHSQLYPRQIPVEGIDSKWLEARLSIFAEWMSALRPSIPPISVSNFYVNCGLKTPPPLLRLRLLCPKLRQQFGGLGDISAPIEQIAQLPIRPTFTLISENLQNALACSDLPNSVVIMARGYSVDVLAQLTWLKASQCYYWGDIDTHGLAILNRARQYLPDLQSLLMDRSILLKHLSLCTTEPSPHSATFLANLSHEEHALYQALKQNHYGYQLRLEQERLPWDIVWEEIHKKMTLRNSLQNSAPF